MPRRISNQGYLPGRYINTSLYRFGSGPQKRSMPYIGDTVFDDKKSEQSAWTRNAVMYGVAANQFGLVGLQNDFPGRFSCSQNPCGP